MELKPTYFKLLIVDDFHQVLLEELNAAGINYEYLPSINKGDIINKFKEGFNAILVRSKLNFDAEVLAQLPELTAIFRGGAGLDNIDEKTCFEKQIYLANSENANSNAVAEHALGLLLGLSNNIAKSFSEIKNQTWLREENRGFELRNKTIGIIGFGNTGFAFARAISGLGLKVLAYDKYKTNYGIEGVTESNWDQILYEADILSLHVPLTSETRYLLNTELINKFRKIPILLNTSRGEIVDTKAVYEALLSKKIVGFGADVLEFENFKTMPNNYKELLEKLYNLNNVVLTPHVAGWTVESYRAIAKTMSNKIIEYYKLREMNIRNKHHFKEDTHVHSTKKTL